MNRAFVAACCCVLALTAAVATVGRAQSHPEPAKHEWDYGSEHGPSHWGELKADFAACRDGQHQSPIDIQSTVKADLPEVQFDYKDSALRVVDNGHSVQVTYDPGSSILVGDHRYALKQFHFHHPSEEKVHGKRFALSLHLVHADAEGHLAVVAVLLDPGAENAQVLDLWRHLPSGKEHEELAEGVTINAAKLLPAARGYYTFDGSLTTPPCSENVTWLVLKQPLAVSSAEIERFAKLYPNDARPSQALNDRVVKETR
jgi:carbonic anhydrase